jgi:hypothetical protein
MNDRALVIAALIIGGAIVAASFQARPRYALSAADNNVAWRMDTWSGQIDICAAAYLPTGPLVKCGVTVVVPAHPQPQPQTQPQQNNLTPLPQGNIL